MVEESQIVSQITEKIPSEQGFHDFKLLRTTAFAHLYIAHKQGKRFLIKTTKDNTKQQLAMLRREYELSICATHPHIVHTYTYITDLEVGEGIIMEYIESRTLAEYLTENPPKSERNRIVNELVSAVGYLHKLGVIHNDLKPENILISRTDNSLKLIDFGLADNDSYYALKSLGCTPHYASPELRERRSGIDARSDIYSVGMIMEQIVGRSAITRRCTKSNPAQRFANISDLQRAWRRRNFRYHVTAAIVTLAVVLTPILVMIQQRVALHNHDRLKQQLVEQVKSDITAICNRTKDSIRCCHYAEFATQHSLILYEQCRHYLDSLTMQITDSDIQTAINNQFRMTYEKGWIETVELMNELNLPVFRIETPAEQWPYYDSLVKNRLPYRPYGKK